MVLFFSLIHLVCSHLLHIKNSPYPQNGYGEKVISYLF